MIKLVIYTLQFQNYRYGNHRKHRYYHMNSETHSFNSLILYNTMLHLQFYYFSILPFHIRYTCTVVYQYAASYVQLTEMNVRIVLHIFCSTLFLLYAFSYAHLDATTVWMFCHNVCTNKGVLQYESWCENSRYMYLQIFFHTYYRKMAFHQCECAYES